MAPETPVLGEQGQKPRSDSRNALRGQLPVRMAQAAVLDGRGKSSGLTSGRATIKSLTPAKCHLSASSQPTRVEARRGACSGQHEAAFPSGGGTAPPANTLHPGFAQPVEGLGINCGQEGKMLQQEEGWLR